jgi:hypothetical protein
LALDCARVGAVAAERPSAIFRACADARSKGHMSMLSLL